MVACFAYDERALIESYVPGREIAVSVVDTGDGPRPLPPVEVVTDGEYDFDARYNPGRSEYFVPARLAAAELALVQETAMTVHYWIMKMNRGGKRRQQKLKIIQFRPKMP